MGRPKTAPLSSFSPTILEQILALRKAHPGWGPITIRVELAMDKNICPLKIPKSSSIALFLKSKGLSKDYEKHINMPRTKFHPPKYPHHIWQIDGQGTMNVDSIGRVNLINTKDAFSKLYCGCLPAFARSHNGSPSATDYQCALRLAYCEFGMPEKIQTDHAPVFFENKGKSPFPTRFHLWLVGLGIDLVYSRKFRPTDQSIVERSHQTLTNQVILGNHFSSIMDLHICCDKRRMRLNNNIPSSSTGNLPPLKAFPHARFSGRWYRPESERQLIDLERVYHYLGQGKWYRKAGKSRTIFLGGQWYYIKQAQAFSKLEITFDPIEKILIFRDDNELLLCKEPIKGITHEELMGESFFKASLPNFQLQFPFNWEDALVSTTFLHSP